MKNVSLIVCLLAVIFATPVYGDDAFVIDFGGGKSVHRDETVDLLELLERSRSGYDGQRLVEVKVYARSRNRHYGGQVQLLNGHGRVVSEDSLRNGYASLPVYGEYGRAALLHFEDDVYLDRIECVTERPRRILKEKHVMIPKGDLEIGNFVKAGYGSEVKKFHVPSGGYSRIDFRVRIEEQYAVIVNSILVLSGDRQLGWKTVGARLSSGDNEFALDVPEDATDIQVTFAHGQGSAVQVILQR